MIRTDGKLHSVVVERLSAEGLNTDHVAVATIGRGSDHLILRGDETIGEYNHVSKKLTIYEPKNTVTYRGQG